MQELFGTYRGVTPTDESDIGLGEMQIVIDADNLTMSVATGLEIQVDVTPMSEIRELSEEEILIELEQGAILPQGTRGIILTDCNIKFIFVSANEESGGVIILGMMDEEFFGPSFVFTPSQIEAGMFDKAIQMLEHNYGTVGVIPMLSSDGKAPNSVRTDSVST